MNDIKRYLRHSFVTVMFLFIVFAVIHFVAYQLWVSPRINWPADMSGIQWMVYYPMGYYTLFCLFYALMAWILIRRSSMALLRKTADIIGPGQSKPKNQRIETEEEKKQKRNAEHRMFLHLLSVLQRDGRLVDFLAEDLSDYDDAQIGSAVRNIHENCKKTLHKYVRPGAVIDKSEGEEVEIETGYDQRAIKLTGNVSGEPPFNGILRHHGWQAAHTEIPRLSDIRNPRIISPAEVEII
ncbi:MAG: DUF2760 domain-containing protein [Desulfobacteraceae bacterium]|nr:DUF2760 domain-containing protein [Desulfobacteraceae bacterium]